MDKDDLNKQIGMKIRQARAIKGWSRDQVADKLKMSVSNYGNIERGETNICISLLVEIIETFNISLPYLLGIDEKNVFNYTKNNSKTGTELIGINPICHNMNNELKLTHQLEIKDILLKERDKEIEHFKSQLEQLKELVSLYKNTCKNGE
jgi:transcriptional regulator with XRE-family HTH domain